MKNKLKTKLFIIYIAFLIVITAFVRIVNAQGAWIESNETNQYIKKTNIKINAINPTPESNPSGAYYPGFRGNNQLIIYTPSFGEYTNTNEFGKEAIVIDNKVFGFCGANCYIPKNGFIISGHGTAKKWINEHLMEGALINVNPDAKMLESTITPESYLYKAGQRIDSAQKILIEYKRILPGYQCKVSDNYLNSALQKYNEAKYMIDKSKYEEGKELADNALKLADMSFYYAIPAVKNELHGVWIRPIEKNPEEIGKTLDRLKKTGIDNVFLETYYQGYTIFPSKTMDSYGIREQRPEFVGWDPLQSWIEEASKRNIKIHVWFQTFYAGNENISDSAKHILSVYPEWANAQKKHANSKKPMPSISEHGGYFLDPANPCVQRFLLSLIDEIVTTYNVDGLNIDYIRYPKSLSPNFPSYLDSAWGYTAFARNEFKAIYGKDPLEINVSDPLLAQWIEYRQSKVNEFVSKIKSTVGNRNILISAVIFPGYKETAVTKLQTWPLWAQNSYIDAFTPLIMSSDRYMAGNSIREIRSLAGNNISIMAGLFEPFTGGSPADLLDQIAAVRKEGTSGVVIFDNAHLEETFIKALSARIFRKD